MTVAINRLLVANRGEIARRIFRTCRRLGIATVAVYSEPDANMPFVHEGDCAVALGGRSPSESYLRGDAIVEAALRSEADAVHPGYGFLAENEDFAQQVIDAGLVWVGPSPEVIHAMGSKIHARERMRRTGVPVLPGQTVGAADRVEAIAARIGYPLLAKASAGGGGKGMRLVRDPAELTRSIAAARGEALAAFGDDAVFLERYVDRPRHVEIQILGDAHGDVVSLYERDCSVQRRHQKVIEESPSPALTDELRERMSAAAVAAATDLQYVGAGTVEFILTPSGEFFFLEVNTRLQVEHTVTELVTGLDLVELQVRIAEGEPLPAEARNAVVHGHAIEARLYAEDPRSGFLPVAGRLERFAVPGRIRLDSGVTDSSEISPHYDPLLAKVIAHGRTRTEAIRLLADALRRATIHGLTTNRDLVVRSLLHPGFAAGDADTGFLDRYASELLMPLVDEIAESRYALSCALAGQAKRRACAPHLPQLSSGWRNNPSQSQQVTYTGTHGEWNIGYRFDRGGDLEELTVNGSPIQARLHVCRETEVDLELDRLRTRCHVRTGEDGRVYVNSAVGQVTFQEVPRFPAGDDGVTPGSLTSPMPGAVLRVTGSAGMHLEAGDPILVIEAMKMEHEIVAPVAGTLSQVLVDEGSRVEAGATLAILDEDA
jgi:propionyl-CoA carboxylase alpha chain